MVPVNAGLEKNPPSGIVGANYTPHPATPKGGRMKPQIVGLVWYKEEQYMEALRLFEDGHKLPDTYAAFVEKAQGGLDHFRAHGANAVKVEADIHEVAAWCRANNHRLDGHGRTAYVNMRLAKMLGILNP
jgi:hypothetical protein